MSEISNDLRYLMEEMSYLANRPNSSEFALTCPSKNNYTTRRNIEDLFPALCAKGATSLNPSVTGVLKFPDKNRDLLERQEYECPAITE